MNKSLIALATVSLAGVASAQSSVTVFGVIDAMVSSYSNRSEDPRGLTPAVTVRRTALGHSGYSTSRLGFRGTEDLGGGLAASFWLEAPITNDDGAMGIANFSRRSTVSLSGGFGEIRLGRDFTPTFWNDTLFDPINTNGAGGNLILAANTAFAGNANYVRASNSIGYFLPPNLGGFHGQLQYALHERDSYDPGTATPPGVHPVTGARNPGTVAPSRTGRYIGGRLGYASGPLQLAVAYGDSTVADNYYAGSTDSVKTMNLGASYHFGSVKLFGEWSRSRHARDLAQPALGGGLRKVDLEGYVVGVTVPVGAGLIRAAYSHVTYDQDNTGAPFGAAKNPKAGKLALGYVHNLSKRTALYATVGHVRNKNGAALTTGGPAFVQSAGLTPKTSTGYDFGIRHAF
ncbi:porin [Variovorax sp. KBS0712]|uniref:porin n=1 Tax=Variovorax sp. KBS0712 TaxID=2578111 RepID=UPI0011182F54|nr:porin [Variovorax sp. KBS0712]TSD58948.1 porin [Variovorax sp. KBS0712]